MKIAFLVLASAALLARPAASSATVDPCKIASLADASKAVGQPVVKATASTMGPTSCAYRSAAFRSLVITVEPFASPAEARHEYTATITSPMTQASPKVQLAGIGDAAQRLGPMIYVLKANSIYAFAVIGSDGNGAGALRTIALAKAVVPKL